MSLQATPAEIPLGGSSRLGWSVSFPAGCSDVEGMLLLAGQNVGLSGNKTIQPLATATYRLAIALTGGQTPELASGERYADALAEHRRILRQAFSAHGGVEVDTQGTPSSSPSRPAGRGRGPRARRRRHWRRGRFASRWACTARRFGEGAAKPDTLLRESHHRTAPEIPRRAGHPPIEQAGVLPSMGRPR